MAAFITCGLGTEAQAQGLLDLLFGTSKPAPAPQPLPSHRHGHPGVTSGQGEAKPSRRDGEAGEQRSTYRTVCVRLCDGFLVPMSFSTTRSNFAQDQARCSAACGAEARLFYHPNPGGAMEDAVDLSGRVYGRLPNAFKFRKTLVDGCQCRPPPWSEAEQARHRSYASAQPVPQSQVSPVRVAQAPIVHNADKTSPNLSKPAQGEKLADAAESALQTAGTAKKSKPRAAPQGAAMANAKPGLGQVPGLVASAKPTAHVVASKPVVVQPTNGSIVLGGGAGMGMGVTGQPKYRWPGD